MFYRSYPSCPSRESNTSPIHNPVNEDHQQQPTTTTTSETMKIDDNRPKLQIAKNLLASPVERKSMPSNSLLSLGLGIGCGQLPSSSLNNKDKKASMLLLGKIFN
jgi:hypothetical protein